MGEEGVALVVPILEICSCITCDIFSTERVDASLCFIT